MQLTLDRLTKQYGSKIALDRIDATFERGFMACLVQMAQEKQRLCVCSAISKILLPGKFC